MIIAVGLNVVIGLAGLLDLGYVGFYALGAYSVAIFGSPSSPVPRRSPTSSASPRLGGAVRSLHPDRHRVAMVAGVLLGAPTLRLRGDYLAIVTMGFGEIIRILSRNLEHDRRARPASPSIPRPPGPESRTDFGPTLSTARPYAGTGSPSRVLMLLIFLARRLEHSRVGRAWLAIREDEDAAG